MRASRAYVRVLLSRACLLRIAVVAAAAMAAAICVGQEAAAEADSINLADRVLRTSLAWAEGRRQEETTPHWEERPPYQILLAEGGSDLRQSVRIRCRLRR
jgi:hypothetical protein